MKEIIKEIGIVIGGTFGVIIFVVSIIWFMSWIFTDPFNIFPPLPKSSNQIVIEECQKIGGFPRLNWNNIYQECKKIELK